MNKIIYYQPDKHDNQLKVWHSKWKLNFDASILPDTGFVVEDVCAAFLLETNSPICFIDYLISNPDVDKTIRDEDLNQVVQAVQELARSKGYKYMMSTTKHTAVVERAKLNGFSVLPDSYSCLGMEL